MVPVETFELFERLYDKLKRLAASLVQEERSDHTFGATALVHEAFLRMSNRSNQSWQDSRHFQAIAVETMRCILVDRARFKVAKKRGGVVNKEECEVVDDVCADAEELLIINELLERLSAEHAEAGELFKLKYFSGFSVEECAKVLGVSRATAYRLWVFAKAWLRVEVDASR